MHWAAMTTPSKQIQKQIRGIERERRKCRIENKNIRASLKMESVAEEKERETIENNFKILRSINITILSSS